MAKCACGNCDWTGTLDQLQPIKRYFERVDEELDSVIPDGECPACGALAYEVPQARARPAAQSIVNVTTGG